MNDPKEVYFWKYCCICKHKDNEEFDEPCDDCLANPSNIDSHKPVHYEPVEK